MDDFGDGWGDASFGWSGYGHFGMGIFSRLLTILGGMVLITAVVIVLFLVIRYLLVATRAAQLYIDRNTPTRDGATRDASGPSVEEPPAS